VIACENTAPGNVIACENTAPGNVIACENTAPACATTCSSTSLFFYFQTFIPSANDGSVYFVII